MQLRSIPLSSAIVLAAVVSGTVTAQDVHRVEVVAGLGVYAPARSIGAAAPSGVWYLDVAQPGSGAAIDVSALFAWPGSALRTRIAGMAMLPVHAGGRMVCYPGVECPLALMAEPDVEVSVMAAVVDIVFTPFHASNAVRPYAAIGVGLKHQRVSWTQNPPPASGTHAETPATVHLGVGLGTRIMGIEVRAEVSDYWTGKRDGLALQADPQQSVSPDRPARHDLMFAVGVRLFRR